MTRLRNYFLTGLVIAAPLFLTIYIVRTFIDWIDSSVTPFIPTRYLPDTYLHYSIPGFGVVVALVFITLLGFLTANFIGRRLLHLGESALGRMPIVRNIYRGLKQIFETAVSSNTKAFKTVALVEFPRKGMWSIVFVVGDTKGEVGLKMPGAENDVVSVFVPTTPTPLSGYLVFVKREDIVVLDMSVEEAAKMVISAALVTPEYNPPATAGDLLTVEEATARIREQQAVNPP